MILMRIALIQVMNLILITIRILKTNFLKIKKINDKIEMWKKTGNPVHCGKD